MLFSVKTLGSILLAFSTLSQASPISKDFTTADIESRMLTGSQKRGGLEPVVDDGGIEYEKRGGTGLVIKDGGIEYEKRGGLHLVVEDGGVSEE